MANVVAIENVGANAPLVQILLKGIRNGRLAGTAQAGEPEDSCPVVVQCLASRLIDGQFLMMNVLCPAQGEVDHACRHGGVGVAINQHTRSQRPIAAIGLKRDATVHAERRHADVVELEFL